MVDKESCLRNIRIQLRALSLNDYLQTIYGTKDVLKPEYSYTLAYLSYHPHQDIDLDPTVINQLQELHLVRIVSPANSIYPKLTPLGQKYIDRYLRYPKLRLLIQWCLTALFKKIPIALFIILLTVGYVYSMVRGMYFLIHILFDYTGTIEMTACHPFLATAESVPCILLYMIILITSGYLVLLIWIPKLYDHLFYKKRIWDGFFLKGADKYNLMKLILLNDLLDPDFMLVYQEIRYSPFLSKMYYQPTSDEF